MTIFETQRLRVRQATPEDTEVLIELMSNPLIIEPIPQPKWTRKEILDKIKSLTDYTANPIDQDKVIWSITTKKSTQTIGILGLLTNNEAHKEIAYRLLPLYWGNGYATEVTQGLINYCFQELELKYLTADVNITNQRSVRVLEKFFSPVKEFFNERDQCTDRRYHLYRTDYQS